MRFPHYIKENSSNESLQEAIFFDTETDQVKVSQDTVRHVLRQGMLAYVRRDSSRAWRNPQYSAFATVRDFWQLVLAKVRRKHRLYLFCHNTNFDLPVLNIFNELPNYGYKLRKAVIEGPPTILEFRRDTDTILVIDTLNYFRMPLEKLGEMIGLPKLKMPDKEAPADEWDRYVRRDVEIILTAITRWADFLIDNDLGGFATTLASQSMRTYRHRFMKHQIGIHTNERALELERQAYNGGRNECFRIGTFHGRFRLLDVNSMYPYVMASRPFPRILSSFTSTCTIEGLARLLQDKLAVARVRIASRDPAYSIRLNGRLCFPIGEFDISLTTPELKYALANGHLKKVYSVAFYAGEYLFTDFVEYMYSRRLQYQAEESHTVAANYKILLNSFYGKWGQRGLKYVSAGQIEDTSAKTWIEVNYQTGAIRKCRQLAGLLQVMEKEKESSESFPAIVAHITAYARMYLWELIKIAGRDNVYYCDTDSLLVNDIGFDKLSSLQHPTELGKLKLEGEYTKVEIRGCKDYEFGDKRKVKGIRKTAIKLAEHTFRQEKWSSLKGMLRNGDMAFCTTSQVEKNLTREYTKGILTPSGVVEPLQLA